MHWLAILGVFLVSIGTILTIIGQNIQSGKNTRQLTDNIQALRQTVVQKDERISDLERRINVINSLEIRVNLDEITKDKTPGEKETSAGLQSAVALFSKGKVRHRFVTDFQYSVQQLSPNIRRATFVYRPEEPTKILGKSIDYLDSMEIFVVNFTDFIDPLGFNRQSQEHMVSVTVLLNGVEIVTLNNLAVHKGQLYSGQLKLDVTKTFRDISAQYQKQIEARSM